jgi:hypothetical protein
MHSVQLPYGVDCDSGEACGERPLSVGAGITSVGLVASALREAAQILPTNRVRL